MADPVVKVLIPYESSLEGRARNLELVLAHYQTHFRDWLVHLAGGYPLSRAMNLGIERARPFDVLVCNFSDCIVPPGQLSRAVRAAWAGNGGVVKPYTLFARLNDAQTAMWPQIPFSFGEVPAEDVGIAQAWVASRETLEIICPWDEGFPEWREDYGQQAVHEAYYGHEPRRIEGYCYHLAHEPHSIKHREEANQWWDTHYVPNLGDYTSLQAVKHVEREGATMAGLPELESAIQAIGAAIARLIDRIQNPPASAVDLQAQVDELTALVAQADAADPSLTAPEPPTAPPVAEEPPSLAELPPDGAGPPDASVTADLPEADQPPPPDPSGEIPAQ